MSGPPQDLHVCLPLGTISLLLLTALLDANLHALFAKRYVLLLHFLSCVVADIVGDAVGHEPDRTYDTNDNQQDYKRQYPAFGHDGCPLEVPMLDCSQIPNDGSSKVRP